MSLAHLIDLFGSLRVLVIGDAMLDVYLDGLVQRVCREAPCPLVDVIDRKEAAGGAANTALNVRSMGAQVAFLSVIGDDEEGKRLRGILAESGVGLDHLLAGKGRATLVKNRITSRSRIVLRFDQGTTADIGRALEEEMKERLSHLFPTADAVVISDYGYGVVTSGLIEKIRGLQSSVPRTLVVDSRRLSEYRSIDVTSVKPNIEEALGLLGLREDSTPEEIALTADRLLDLTGARIAAVTLDSKGALFLEKGQRPYRTYATPAGETRAIGAGDTFTAALALCLALDAPTAAAAEVASAAAAVVVEKEGTTPCRADELKEYLLPQTKCIEGLGRLAERVDAYRRRGLRMVFTNGCFDILHRGHISYLNQAKAMGDVLIVGVNSDSGVRRLKGPGRPVNNLADRTRVLAALSCVDHIIAFDEETPAEVIKVVRPDIFTKGGDYTLATLPEAPLVSSLGGQVRILPYIENVSTTGIIDRMKRTAEQGKALQPRGAVNEPGGRPPAAMGRRKVQG